MPQHAFPSKEQPFSTAILLTIISIFGVWLTVPAGADTAGLELAGYLGQVRSSNQGVQAAQVNSQANAQASYEGFLPFGPQFFTTLQYSDDSRQTLVPLFQGTRTVSESSQLGVKKLFDFGLQAQVSYGLVATNIFGVSAQLVPQTNLITGNLSLQLTQQFWQNGFGKADRAQQAATEATDLAQSYMQSYQEKVALADAETRFWALAMARELVRVQRESYQRTAAIRDINAKRAKAHLIDESDLLTSIAQTKSKEFDLASAVDHERVAARAFNSARGIDSDSVNEDLHLPDATELRDLKPPKRSEMRDDVKSAEQTRKSVAASSEAAIQKQLPSLSLTGNVSSNGMEPGLGQTLVDTTTTQYPYYAVGVNFSAPLDFDGVKRVKSAYAAQMHGADLAFHRKLFDQENDWQDLVRQLDESKARLRLAVDLEQAQKQKFQHESQRRKEGASTTYQVFLFEIDYLNAEVNRIQTEATILSLVAQLKTYGSEM